MMQVIPAVEVETPDAIELRPAKPLPRGQVSVRPNEDGKLAWFVTLPEPEPEPAPEPEIYP